MKYVSTRFFKFLVVSFLLANSTNVFAEKEYVDGKRAMTEEEVGASIGRMGEVDEIPEGFEFSKMENVLWRSNHLENITEPARLYYEFSKSGSYEEGFEDSVFLDILTINEDGTKNANLEFFTADRKQTIRPDNVTNIVGNPVLGIFMQGDAYEMDRYTGGSWRHFMKRLKISFRNDGVVEPVTIEYAGQKYEAKKYSVQPYLNDPRRRQYEDMAQKEYEFIFSDEIPGKLYKIRTIIPGAEGDEEPLVEEVLTLTEIATES